MAAVRVCSLLCVALLSVWPFALSAQDKGARGARARVILVNLGKIEPASSWPRAEARLKAELSLLQIEVLTIESTQRDLEDRLEEMTRLAREHDAIGALSLQRSPKNRLHIRMWLEDSVTNKYSMRKIELSPDSSDPAAEVAIQAVELLRASLLEARDARLERQRIEASRQKIVFDLTRPMLPPRRPPRQLGSVELGAGALGGGSSLPWMPGLQLGLQLQLWPRWSLGLLGFVTVGDAAIALSSSEQVDLGAAQGQLQLGWSPFVDWGALQPQLGLGLGSVLFWSSPRRGQLEQGSDLAQSALVDLRASLDWELVDWLSLRAWGSLQSFWPTIALQLEQDVLGELGPLSWSAGVSVRLRWWSGVGPAAP